MGKQSKETPNRNSLYFRIISWLLLGIIFALIEISLRLFSYGTDMHLFVKQKVETGEQYLKVNPHVGEKYFTRLEATTGTNDMFLRRKPENGFRVFLLGSSTLYGYPYDFNLMSSRILGKILQMDDSYFLSLPHNGRSGLIYKILYPHYLYSILPFQIYY